MPISASSSIAVNAPLLNGSPSAVPLRLDEFTPVRHHHVKIDIGVLVHLVIEVQKSLAVEDADTDRSHLVDERARFALFLRSSRLIASASAT